MKKARFPGTDGARISGNGFFGGKALIAVKVSCSGLCGDRTAFGGVYRVKSEKRDEKECLNGVMWIKG